MTASSWKICAQCRSWGLYTGLYWLHRRCSLMYSSVNNTLRGKTPRLIILLKREFPFNQVLPSLNFTAPVPMDRSTTHSRNRSSNNHHPYYHQHLHQSHGRARSFAPPGSSSRYPPGHHHQTAGYPPPPAPHLPPNPMMPPSDFSHPSHFWYVSYSIING